MAAVPPPPAPESEPWRNPWRAPGARRKRVRWGYGDAVLATVAGIVGSAVVGALSVMIRHPSTVAGENVKTDSLDTLWIAVGQFALMFGVAVLLVRWKGWRKLADVGVDRPRPRDLRYVGLGAGAGFLLNLSTVPASALWTRAGYGSQAIGKDLQDARGLTALALFLVIVVVAPITEELLFRGIVLRSSLRHFDAVPSVLIAGLVFGTFHSVDPNTIPSLPALAAFGTVAAVVAVRTGRLVPAIGMHMGFNLLGAALLLVSR